MRKDPMRYLEFSLVFISKHYFTTRTSLQRFRELIAKNRCSTSLLMCIKYLDVQSMSGLDRVE